MRHVRNPSLSCQVPGGLAEVTSASGQGCMNEVRYRCCGAVEVAARRRRQRRKTVADARRRRGTPRRRTRRARTARGTPARPGSGTRPSGHSRQPGRRRAGPRASLIALPPRLGRNAVKRSSSYPALYTCTLTRTESSYRSRPAGSDSRYARRTPGNSARTRRRRADPVDAERDDPVADGPAAGHTRPPFPGYRTSCARRTPRNRSSGWPHRPARARHSGCSRSTTGPRHRGGRAVPPASSSSRTRCAHAWP